MSATQSASTGPPPPPPPPPPPAPPRAPAAWQSALPRPFNVIPVELLAVCGLMALAGVLVLWPVLKSLPDVFDLLGASGLARDLGLLLLSVWVMLGVFGGSCLLLSWRLAHGDRVARGLTYVLGGGLGVAILIGDAKSDGLVIVMLACFGAVGTLWLSPRVNAFFAGQAAPQGAQPVPLVVARTLVAYWAFAVTLYGLMFLPLGGLGGKFVVIGLIMVVLGGSAFFLNRQLADGDARARTIVTVGAGIYFLLALILGRRDPALIVPLALAAGVAWNLWVPADAKRHFAQATV